MTTKQRVIDCYLQFEKHRWYINKEATIEKWILEDRERDRFFNAVEPSFIPDCLACGKKMRLEFKNMADWSSKRMQFWFQCSNGCLPKRVFFEDGSERVFKPSLCPHCSVKLDSETIEKPKVISIKYSCPQCEFTEKTELELEVKEPLLDAGYPEDRARYCLSNEEGQKLARDIEAFQGLRDLFEKFESAQAETGEAPELYSQLSEIKFLNVGQVKKYLHSKIDPLPYENLCFEKPNLSRVVSIEFALEDLSDKDENAVRRMLKKQMIAILINTNWRLMSEGIFSRLGVYYGKIRAYESQEDLLAVLGKERQKIAGKR